MELIPMKKFKGMILFEGGKYNPIVILYKYDSDNEKTGNMGQIYIIRSDMLPSEALKTGNDYIICGDCIHSKQGTCYVNVGTGVNSIYRSWLNGNYEPLNYKILKYKLKNSFVRFGAYGDPVFIPLELVEFISKNCKGWTGYSHQWQDPQFNAYKRYFMASVDNESEYQKSIDLGWRSYRVSTNNETLNGEIMCPHDAESDTPIQCADCRLCDGLGRHKNARNIAVIVHGLQYKINKFNSIQVSTV